MRNAGIKIRGRDSNNLIYVGASTLKAESEEELKSLLRRVKQAREKADLKPNIQTFLGSKMTADGDCSRKLKDSCSLEEKL